MLTEEQVAEFHENGFLNGGPLLDAAQVEVLREELQRVIANKDRDDCAAAGCCCGTCTATILRPCGKL